MEKRTGKKNGSSDLVDLNWGLSDWSEDRVRNPLGLVYYDWFRRAKSVNTLYKLYTVPVRICSTCEDIQYPWVISSLPVRICITRESYPQYLWVISSLPVRICITRESYPQYLWVISPVPVKICITRKPYPQNLWVISSVPVRICSTRELYPQYLGVISSVNVHQFNYVSIRGMLYYELSLWCMLQCTLVLVTTQFFSTVWLHGKARPWPSGSCLYQMIISYSVIEILSSCEEKCAVP